MFRFTHGPDPSYPTAPQVWLQWLRNTSYVFLPLAVSCLLLMVVRGVRGAWPLMLCFSWGATLATLADWKQTKHLMLSLPFLTMALPLAWARLGGHWRRIMAVVLGTVLLVNAWSLVRLSQDFSFLAPSKVW